MAFCASISFRYQKKDVRQKNCASETGQPQCDIIFSYICHAAYIFIAHVLVRIIMLIQTDIRFYRMFQLCDIRIIFSTRLYMLDGTIKFNFDDNNEIKFATMIAKTLERKLVCVRTCVLACMNYNIADYYYTFTTYFLISTNFRSANQMSHMQKFQLISLFHEITHYHRFPLNSHDLRTVHSEIFY